MKLYPVDAFGRVWNRERICWFTCHGFYPDWCIFSGAKLLQRFKYAFIILCRVLLLLIIHNTRHASDVLHQSLHIYKGGFSSSRLLRSLLSDIGYTAVVLHEIDEKTFCRNFSHISRISLKKERKQFASRIETKKLRAINKTKSRSFFFIINSDFFLSIQFAYENSNIVIYIFLGWDYLN